MIKDYIFPSKNRFKIVGDTEEHFLVEYYKTNQLVEEFYIPKQDDPDTIRVALMYWYSQRFLIKVPSNTTFSSTKS